jgi:O-antigen/teichoic acid export membrane protein
VLGEKWLAGVRVMEILSINSAILVFHGTIVTLFIAIGRPLSATRINFFFVIVLAVGLATLTRDFGPVGAAYSALIACTISTPVYLIQLRRFIGLPLLQFVMALVRPTLAAIVMVAVLRQLTPAYTIGMSVPDGVKLLITAISIGGLTYTATLVSLWFLTGRRPGAESQILEKVLPRYVALIRKVRSRKGQNNDE